MLLGIVWNWSVVIYKAWSTMAIIIWIEVTENVRKTWPYVTKSITLIWMVDRYGLRYLGTYFYMKRITNIARINYVKVRRHWPKHDNRSSDRYRRKNEKGHQNSLEILKESNGTYYLISWKILISTFNFI